MHKTQHARTFSRMARRAAAAVLAAELALSPLACAPGLSRLSYRNFGDVIYVEELGKALDVSAVRRMEGDRQFDVIRTRAGTFILGRGFSHLYRIENNQLSYVSLGSPLAHPQPFAVGKTLVVYDSGRLIAWRGEDIGLYQLGIAQATLLASEKALFIIGGKAAFLFTEEYGLREIGISGILAEEGVPEILEPAVKDLGEDFSLTGSNLKKSYLYKKRAPEISYKEVEKHDER
ncbi:MAG: hypothetical protein QXG98_01905 [Candidatus Micrarchaeia archaeon]